MAPSTIGPAKEAPTVLRRASKTFRGARHDPVRPFSLPFSRPIFVPSVVVRARVRRRPCGFAFVLRRGAGSTATPKAPSPERAACTACHTVTPDLSAHSPREIHALHAGDLARPEGDCLQCHEDDGRFLVARANACSGCHADFVKKAPHDAKKISEADCASCHTTDAVRSAHLGAKETTAREGLKSLVSVDVTDAKIVREADAAYAEVTFRLLDAEGRPVPMATKDPADAPWIKNLQPTSIGTLKATSR